MNRTLVLRSLRDSLALLLGCCALLTVLVWLRLWIVAQMDFQVFIRIFAEGGLPKFIENMIPVPIEVLATIEGRVAYGYEEFQAVGLMALWTVTRGTDCLAGRLGRGTMELLLAQPLRRITLVTSHSMVSLVGAAAVALAVWLGTTVGIHTVSFDEPTSADVYLPATIHLFCLGTMFLGISTLASALARSRSQAVGIVVGFLIFQATCTTLGMASQKVAWLQKLSLLTCYDPTLLTIGLEKEPASNWPMFWQYSVALAGIGLVAWAIAAAVFCHRDVPAPL